MNLSATRTGLVVAEHAADEQSVGRALRSFDPSLVLSRDFDDRHQAFVFVVVKRMGSDRPAVHICDWRDDQGRPLPLSHRLVDKARSLHMGSRAPRVDVEAENQRLRDAAAREFEEYADEWAKEMVPRLRGIHSSVLPRGLYRRNTAFKDVTDVR